MYYTYILKSTKDKKYYYGSTSNVKRRLDEHNNGRVEATKFRRPLLIHYYEQFKIRKKAIRREMFFKKEVDING